jgi:DNA replication protein DnaC
VGLTSNLDFAHWTEVFGQEQMTAALLDRLVHRSTILSLVGESYRFRHSLATQTTSRDHERKEVLSD